MTTLDIPRPTSLPVWEVPRWATYMDLNAPEGAGGTGYKFSPDHGSISYSRDFPGGYITVEGQLELDLESRVTVSFGDIEVHLHAGFGDNEHAFTVQQSRDQLVAFESSPPSLGPLAELHAALAEVVGILDRAEARDV